MGNWIRWSCQRFIARKIKQEVKETENEIIEIDELS